MYIHGQCILLLFLWLCWGFFSTGNGWKVYMLIHLKLILLPVYVCSVWLGLCIFLWFSTHHTHYSVIYIHTIHYWFTGSCIGVIYGKITTKTPKTNERDKYKGQRLIVLYIRLENGHTYRKQKCSYLSSYVNMSFCRSDTLGPLNKWKSLVM